MIRRSLLLLVALLAMGLTISAATMTNKELADYLDGKICAQYFAGNHAENGLGYTSCSGVFRKTGDTSVAVDYFYGKYTLNFTINSNLQLVLNCGDRNTYPSSDGSSSKVNIYPTTLGGQSYTVGSREVLYCYVYSRNNNTTTTSTTFDNITGNQANVDGFTFSDYLAVQPSDNAVQEWVFYNIKLFVMEPNGVQYDDTGMDNVRYTIEDNKLSIQNFWGLGIPYINTYKGYNGATANTVTLTGTIYADIDSEGNFTMPAFIVGGAKDPDYYGFKNSGNSNSISAGGRTWSGTKDVPNGYYFDPDNVSPFLNRVSGGRNNSTAVKGKVYANPYNHVGNVANNNWASDSQTTGSSVKTYKGEVVRFDETHFFSGTTDAFQTSQILMLRSEDAEITHKASIQVDKKGYGPASTWENPTNVLWIKGSIIPGANADYVKEYELYVVADKVTSVTTANNDSENGLKNSMNISDRLYWTGYTGEPKSQLRPLAVDEDKDADLENSFDGGAYHFNRLVTEEQLLEAGLDPGSDDTVKNFTIYAKAIYQPETGLAPTFHALTNLDNIFTTGVESIVSDNNEDAPAVYYNLNGVQMNGDALTPGIYIRRQGNTAEKVVIR